MMTEADISVMQLQAKKCQGLSANHRKPEKDEEEFSLQVSEVPWPC